MKKIEIEHRMAEVEDVSKVIEQTFNNTLEEARKNEASKDELLKMLSDISSFSKDIISAALNLKDGEKTKFLEESLTKIHGWSLSEADRIKLKNQLIQERIASLKSISNFMTDRIKMYDSRAKAIERVADPNRDKKHPEKLSVRRAAIESQNIANEDEED